VDQCLRLTVDARAGQETRMEMSAGSSLRGKPAGSDRQLEVDVGLCADIAWSTASDREA